MAKRMLNWPEYRTWIRAGVRLFDTIPSVLLPGERISYMRIADLEEAADLLGVPWRHLARACRHDG